MHFTAFYRKELINKDIKNNHFLTCMACDMTSEVIFAEVKLWVVILETEEFYHLGISYSFDSFMQKRITQ